jgi:hypothetical protein
MRVPGAFVGDCLAKGGAMSDKVYRWAIVLALIVIALAQVSQSLNSYGIEEQLEDLVRLLGS